MREDLGALKRSAWKVQLGATAAVGEGGGDSGVDIMRGEGGHGRRRVAGAVGEGEGDSGVDIMRGEGGNGRRRVEGAEHERRGEGSADIARGRRGSTGSKGVGERSVLELELLKLQGEGLAFVGGVGGAGLRGGRAFRRGRGPRGCGGWWRGREAGGRQGRVGDVVITEARKQDVVVGVGEAASSELVDNGVDVLL